MRCTLAMTVTSGRVKYFHANHPPVPAAASKTTTRIHVLLELFVAGWKICVSAEGWNCSGCKDGANPGVSAEAVLAATDFPQARQNCWPGVKAAPQAAQTRCSCFAGIGCAGGEAVQSSELWSATFAGTGAGAA